MSRNNVKYVFLFLISVGIFFLLYLVIEQNSKNEPEPKVHHEHVDEPSERHVVASTVVDVVKTSTSTSSSTTTTTSAQPTKKTHVDQRPLLDKLDDVIDEILCAPVSDNSSCIRTNVPNNETSLQILQQLKRSTMLVVVFNTKKNYLVAPLMHALYARIFDHIRYCGPSADWSDVVAEFQGVFDEAVAKELSSLYHCHRQFGEERIENAGETAYYCFNLAAAAFKNENPKRELAGVFILHEDAFLNFWQIAAQKNSLDLKVSHSLPIGIQPPYYAYSVENLKVCPFNFSHNADPVLGDANDCTKPNSYRGWPKWYKPYSMEFWNELVERGQDPGVFSDCLQNISRRAGGQFRMFPGSVEAFYIASRDFRAVSAMFSVAARNHVYQEIAVPTSLACLDPETTGVLDPTGVRAEPSSLKPPWLADDNQMLVRTFKLTNVARLISLHVSSDSSDKMEAEKLRQAKYERICLYCSIKYNSKMLCLRNENNTK